MKSKIAAIAVAATFAASAAMAQGTQGVTATEILLGSSVDLTGPVAAIGAALAVLVLAQVSLAVLLGRHSLASGRRGRGPVSPRLAVWVALSFLVGGVFGTVQTSLTAALAGTEHAPLTGVVYAFVGLGSAVSG